MKKWILGAAVLMGVVSTGFVVAASTYNNTSTQGVVEIRDKDYQDFIDRGVTVVEFYKPGCGACERTRPHYEKVAKEMASMARFAKLNVSGARTAREERINLTPTFVVYRDGEEIGRSRGGANAEQLRAFFERVFNQG